MSNILKAIRMEYYILKTVYKLFALIYVIAILLSVLTKIPVIAVAIVIVFSAIFSSLFFLLYERNNLSKLYGILPLGKFEVVAGKYLYALCFGILNLIVSGILAYLISLVTDKGIDHITFVVLLSAAFLYLCLFSGVSFPLFYKFGYSRANVFTNLPLYLVAIGSMLIVRKTGAVSGIKQFFATNTNMIWVIGVGTGLILLAISCYLSFLINKNNER